MGGRKATSVTENGSTSLAERPRGLVVPKSKQQHVAVMTTTTTDEPDESVRNATIVGENIEESTNLLETSL